MPIPEPSTGSKVSLCYVRPTGEGVGIIDTANGVEIHITKGEDSYCFLIDLFYLDGNNCHDDPPCVQVVIYNPTEPEGDPLMHIKVHPDGKLEIAE